MGDRDSVGGDEFIATQITSSRSGGIDTKAMENDGIDIEKYRKPKTTIISIRIERRAMGV
ncbi:MAG: hypothetical protein JSC189_000043 [Candidatus Tokpelaia sp. JSC189]|nr:MAG: hypothetical protein JSC189_000043 [Candidatus Tokpelaia sp. JSC189]